MRSSPSISPTPLDDRHVYLVLINFGEMSGAILDFMDANRLRHERGGPFHPMEVPVFSFAALAVVVSDIRVAREQNTDDARAQASPPTKPRSSRSSA